MKRKLAPLVLIVAALLGLALLGLAAGLAGCGVESDGPAITVTMQETVTCEAGSTRREQVAPNLIQAFYPCCDGTAHYIPEILVPKDFRGMLEAGPHNTLCVPDEFSTDAAYTPRQCVSVFGLKGACLTICLPQIRDADIPLPKDSCPGNQKCAPCVDPRTNQATGACNYGAMACDPPTDSGPCRDYEPTLDVSAYPSCGPRAHCASPDLVGQGQQADLATCPDGQSFCVPDDFLKRGGRYTPPVCSSVGQREGRCLSTALPKVAAGQAELPISSCNPTDEVCVPCYDPRTGMGTGACTIGFCERGPVEGPRTFEQCGFQGTDAYCVPSNLIPESEWANFDSMGCRTSLCTEPNTLCVPKKIIDAGTSFSPKPCENPLTGFLAFFLEFFTDIFAAIDAIDEYKEGRCLSRCLPEVRPQAEKLGRHDCDETEVCVPCFDPQRVSEGKVPTGACDR